MALLPLIAESREPRELLVVARQMAFYVDDGRTSNPTIRVSPGEHIRIIFVNDDAGFDHDFAVADWTAGTPVLHGKGRTSIDLHAPAKPGRAAYVCSMHASMMRGIIEVTASGPTVLDR
jgi:plastocyanin